MRGSVHFKILPRDLYDNQLVRTFYHNNNKKIKYKKINVFRYKVSLDKKQLINKKTKEYNNISNKTEGQYILQGKCSVSSLVLLPCTCTCTTIILLLHSHKAVSVVSFNFASCQYNMCAVFYLIIHQSIRQTLPKQPSWSFEPIYCY